MKKWKTSAADWNRDHPIGIGVLVKLDNGKLWHTRTRGEACELGHGQPVVALEGQTDGYKAGGYDLARVTPMEREETPLA
jgi:hypothetical protein